MARLLQLCHGYPPRQNAGTEQYARGVADGLRARGWDVHTLAAAPNPGAPMYAVEEEPGLTRVANNAPYAGLRRGASDPAFDRLVRDAVRRFRPDVVHVQHLAFLSAGVRLDVPTVWTLHDAWAWCAAGGLLLRDGVPCAGPDEACPRCASAWARDTPALARALGVAGRLGRWVPPGALQAAWRRVPGAARERMVGGSTPPLTTADVVRRRTAIDAFARRCDRIVSPSAFLAAEARRNGIAVTDVVPHGADPVPVPRTERAYLLFLGTLARHKGPHLVRAAWERSGVRLPLRVHGPPGDDPAFAVPNDGPVRAEQVPALLAGARALVLGSIWPENAPLVVLEARAAGCPIVAPAIGGLPELVEPGVDGWLYPPGDVEALAACIRAAAEATLAPRPPPSFAAHLDLLEGVYSAACPHRGV